MQRLMIALTSAALFAACATKSPSKPASTEPLIEQKPPAANPTPVVEPREPCAELEGDWPMFQRNAARSGSVDFPALQEPRLRWSQKIGIAGWLNNPIIAGGHVFAPSSGVVWNKSDGSDGVYALSLESGEIAWFRPTENDANAVAYANCRVFATSDAGEVIAIDSRNGEVLWERSFDGKMYANPLVLGDTVVVAGAPGVVEALDVETGKRKWAASVDGAVRGGAAADGAHVYVATEDGRVFALDRDDGSERWMATVNDPAAKAIYAVPTVSAGRLYVGYVRDTSYEVPALAAFDTNSGTQVWAARNSDDFDGGWGNVRSSVAVHGERLYWGEPYSNRVVSASATDGEVVQSIAAGYCMFPHWPSPAIASGTVYVGRHDGGLYAIDADDGTVVWQQFVGDQRTVSGDTPAEFAERGANRCEWDPAFGKPVFASTAVASDGTLVVATGDGWVHAFGEREVAVKPPAP